MHIFIVVKGGVVQEVRGTKEAKVTLIDYDDAVESASIEEYEKQTLDGRTYGQLESDTIRIF